MPGPYAPAQIYGSCNVLFFGLLVFFTFVGTQVFGGRLHDNGQGPPESEGENAGDSIDESHQFVVSAGIAKIYQGHNQADGQAYDGQNFQ